MAITSDQRVDGLDQGPKDGQLGHECERFHERDEVRDLKPGRASSDPTAGRIAHVHLLEQPIFRRRVGRDLGRTLERRQSKSVSSIHAAKQEGGPGAEAAIGVVEDVEIGPSGALGNRLSKRATH